MMLSSSKLGLMAVLMFVTKIN